jgi:hypothetical protein
MVPSSRCCHCWRGSVFSLHPLLGCCYPLLRAPFLHVCFSGCLQLPLSWHRFVSPVVSGCCLQLYHCCICLFPVSTPPLLMALMRDPGTLLGLQRSVGAVHAWLSSLTVDAIASFLATLVVALVFFWHSCGRSYSVLIELPHKFSSMSRPSMVGTPVVGLLSLISLAIDCSRLSTLLFFVPLAQW